MSLQIEGYGAHIRLAYTPQVNEVSSAVTERSSPLEGRGVGVCSLPCTRGRLNNEFATSF